MVLAKYLVIRFSSIGDIVLTTPVVRILKQQVKEAEVHFLTKTPFVTLLKANPYIDKVHGTDGTLNDVITALKAENFDGIIDLHNNLRSLKVKTLLGKPSTSFDKLNFKKWMLVNLKVNRLPAMHIVDRYLKSISHLNVHNDLKGLDYFIDKNDEVDLNVFPEKFKNGYIALVIGANHATKKMPAEKLSKIIKELNYPTMILGGSGDSQDGEKIANENANIAINTCGKYSINQSASLIKQANVVISHDTGLMHIAAAFNKKIVSVWGNTVPEFGMTPYLPQFPGNSEVLEVKNLSCRPCSKIGYKECPKKHFNCMNHLQNSEVVHAVNRFLNK